jgi:hypothetical protein
MSLAYPESNWKWIQSQLGGLGLGRSLPIGCQSSTDGRGFTGNCSLGEIFMPELSIRLSTRSIGCPHSIMTDRRNDSSRRAKGESRLGEPPIDHPERSRPSHGSRIDRGGRSRQTPATRITRVVGAEVSERPDPVQLRPLEGCVRGRTGVFASVVLSLHRRTILSRGGSAVHGRPARPSGDVTQRPHPLELWPRVRSFCLWIGGFVSFVLRLHPIIPPSKCRSMDKRQGSNTLCGSI